MIIMRVVGLSVDNTAKTPIVLLKSQDDDRVLPIWIGAMEAMSISLALSQQKVPRPLTHDLILNTIATLGARLLAVEIHSFMDGVFIADLILRRQESEDATIRIDCRPSDAIALAIRLAVPITVQENVLQEAEEAKQRQDSASFQPANLNQNVEDFAESLIAKEQEPNSTQTKTESPQSNKPITKRISIQKIQKPTVHTVTHASHSDEEKELSKLLQSLEPESSRKM